MLPPGTLAAAGGPLGVLSGGLAGRADLAVDPNEPLYCSCQRVSFGDMVACEADTCPIEWFHYECVGAFELLRSAFSAFADAYDCTAMQGCRPGRSPRGNGTALAALRSGKASARSWGEEASK